MIFTFGYLGRSPDDLAAILAERGAMLVDIRFQPRSRVPAWNGGRLAARFGDAYLHLPQLGNRNYRTGGPVELADYPAGRAALAGLGRDADRQSRAGQRRPRPSGCRADASRRDARTGRRV